MDYNQDQIKAQANKAMAGLRSGFRGHVESTVKTRKLWVDCLVCSCKYHM